MVTGEETERQKLEAQLRIAEERFQRAAVQLLQEGKVCPQLVPLALARVTGEAGAGAALAGDQDPDALLGELAEVVRQAGREFQEMVQAEAFPTAGNA